MAELSLSVLLRAIDSASGPLKAISARGKETAAALKETQAALRSLEGQSRQVAGLEAQRAKLATLTRAIDEQKQALRELRAQRDAADGPARDRLTAQAERQGRAVQRMTASAKALSAAISQTETALTAAGIDTGDLTAAQARLAARIATTNGRLAAQQTELARLMARQRASAAAARAYEQAQSRAASLRGAGYATAGTGAAAGVGVGATVRAYADQEDAATRLQVAMMRTGAAVPDTFRQMNALAEELGDKLPGTTADFARTMTMLQRQGMAAETVLAGTGRAAAYLGVMLQQAPESAAEFAAKLQDATGTAAADMLRLADTIQRTYYLGVDPENMLGAYSALSPALVAIKQQGAHGAASMAPLIAMLDQASLSGHAAGNALRKVFSRTFHPDVAKANSDLKQFGIKLDFLDKKGEFRGLDNLFSQLAKLKQLSTEQRLATLTRIWGDDSETLQALNTMIEKGAAGYAEMSAKLADQADLQQRINALLGTTRNLWDAASGSFTNLLAEIGKLLAPDIRALTVWFGEMTVKLRAWVAANPELATTLARVAAAVAVLLVVGGALLILFGALSSVFAVARFGLALLSFSRIASGAMLLGRVALPILTGALTSLATVCMAHPIIALIAAIVAAAAYVWRNWETLGPKFAALWADIVSGAQAAWSAFSAWFSGMWARVVAAAQSAWEQIKAGFADLPSALAGIGAAIIDGIRAGIASRAAAVLSFISGIASQISAAFKDALSINSPSRVFAIHGSNIVAGLTLGMRTAAAGAYSQAGSVARGVSLAAVGALSTPLAAAPLSPAAGPAAAAGDHITITINAPAAADASAIAREIERTLAARDRARAARRRGALTDLD